MAIIKGSNRADRIFGFDEDDLIFAFGGNDFVDGGGGNDLIFAGRGDDVVLGGTGEDCLFGQRGDDTLDGGAGSDSVDAGRGRDVGVYRVAENAGNRDCYDGGEGVDTLRLVLTAEEAQSAAIQADIAAFREFLATHNNPDSDDNPSFHFTAFDLTVRNWEALEVVVLDEPKPPVLSIDDATVTEGSPDGPNATITFTITRSGNLSSTSTVAYTVVPGSATTPEDYDGSRDPLAGTVTFEPGETSRTITLEIVDDLRPEGIETFTVRLGGAQGAVVGRGEGIGTIVDDDAPPPQPQVSIVATDPDASEAGPNIGTFVVSRTGPTDTELIVHVTVGGSASEGSDYAPLSRTITIPAGQSSSAPFVITPTDDAVVEGPETVVVTIAADAAYAIGTPSSGTVTIADDDVQPPQPQVSIVATDPNASETGPDSGTFIVSRTGPTDAELVVRVTVGGSASEGSDYAPLSRTITIAAGQSSSAPFVVTPVDDAVVEQPETVVVTLVADPAYVVGTPSSGAVTIADDDVQPPQPQVSIVATDPDASEAGSNTGAFTISRTGPTDTELVVRYTVAGTATEGSDYQAITREVTIPVGQSSASFVITPTDDAVVEGAESVVVTLAADPAYTIGAPNSGTVTIADDDVQPPQPQVSIVATDPDASEAGPNTGSFTISRTGPTDTELVVRYTVAGTATEGSDYQAITREVTIPVGQSSASFVITPIDDAVVEGAETVVATLAADAAYTIGAPSSGTVTIADNDEPPQQFDIVWTNGGSVVLGTAAAPTTFNVGTNAAVPAGVAWTGATASDNWSQAGNWTTSAPPGAADVAVFGAAGSGTNVVDTDFQIASLRYSGAAGHVTDLGNGNTLQVSGAAAVHVANADLRSSLAVLDGTTVVAHLSELNVGFVGTGSGSATGSLFIGPTASLDASDVDALSIGRESGVIPGFGSTANGSLTLASNSTLTLGTAAAPATLNVGWSQNVNFGGNGNATGVLDVLDRTAVLNLNLSEVNIGRGALYGAGNGTLRWNQGEVLTAANVYFGRGAATGVLEVPAGGEFLLGSASAPVGNLRIAYNDAGNGTARAALDFSQTNPTFTAVIARELTIGSETGVVPNWSTAANGSLTLASNSTLTLGTAATPATLNVGWSQNVNYGFSSGGSANGALDVLDRAAVLNLNLSEVNIGRGSLYGVGNGTLRWNQGEVLTAANVYFGRGAATGVLEVPAGGEFLLGSASAPVGNLRIAYNDAGNGTARAALDFSQTNPTFTAFVATELTIGAETGSVGNESNDANGSLRLASNSTLTLGTTAAPATLNIGWSQNTNFGIGIGTSSATGVLDALDRGTALSLQLSELNVGRGAFDGVGNGTLRWNQSEVIDAASVYFGRGSATGTLEVPVGGEFLLGSASAPVGNLRIGYNDAGGGIARAALDFSQTDPTFTAFLANELTIGSETGKPFNLSTSADGSLRLGENSTLTLGTTATPATLNIGWSQNTEFGIGIGTASAVGVLDASEGSLTAIVSRLNVGVTAAFGSSSGELVIGSGVTMQATTVNIGVGPNATGSVRFADGFIGSFNAQTTNLSQGQFELGSNTLDIGGTGSIAVQTFNQSAGVLTGNAVDLNAGGTFNFAGVVNGTLNENGGTLAVGGTGIATATLNGNYNLAAAGTLEIQLGATTGDQLAVNGNVDLNGPGTTGGTLDTTLTAAPELNDSFTILLNDGTDAIAGEFAGLADGATFVETFGGDAFTFAIDYQGGDGNDISLTVTQVAATTPASESSTVDDDTTADASSIPAFVVELIGVVPGDPALHGYGA